MSMLDMIIFNSEKYNQVELTVHEIPHDYKGCNWEEENHDEYDNENRKIEEGKDFVHPFYAKELNSEADFNAGFYVGTTYRFNEIKIYDEYNWEIVHENREFEIPDEYEEYNLENEDFDEYEEKNKEIEGNSEMNDNTIPKSYEEFLAKISTEQQNKHFWSKENIEKQNEWNSNLIKALEHFWCESFNKTQLRCPIVVSSFCKWAESLGLKYARSKSWLLKVMEGHHVYDIVGTMIPYLSKDAQKRIASIHKKARFVEKFRRKKFCCPKCGHTNDPNRIPCCYKDKRKDGRQCGHWTIKRGAVHSVIPSLKVILNAMH